MKAIAIEKEKQKLLKKKNQSQNIASAKKNIGTHERRRWFDKNNCEKSLGELSEKLTKEQMKMYKRAKNYVNFGELSKAMASIRSNGIAEVTSDVLDQLQAKHPRRRRVVEFPSSEQITIDKEAFIEDDESKEKCQEFSRSVSRCTNLSIT